ncbi:hypothetical protein [Aureliella helgolandensis]|uniref:Uncharacterized protein n=1 Tax=Aureliella helgolandensis TaxID=2527968 RepID=A0A518G2G3_9BACT|nr:hypothetical protein [Aureliella helgolandensis]QDV22796.1 hypothetical protein Q31a_10870 [Aureliella helgolandensis]
MNSSFLPSDGSTLSLRLIGNQPELPPAAVLWYAQRACLIACLGWLLSTAGGCAQWTPFSKAETEAANNDTLARGLPVRQMSPDSVVIETVLVRFPLHSEAQLSEIWQHTDETILPVSQRQRLDNNGLRVGVLLSELPQVIRDRLHETGTDQALDALEHAGLAADADNKMRKLQCRSGRRKDLLMRRQLQDPLTILSTLDGKRVSGETFDRAQILFDLRAIPQGDGTAVVELTPEVQHGEQRQAFVSTDYGVRPEMKRAQKTWDPLAVRVQLKPKQILVMSCTDPPKAVGKAFFMTKTADHSEERVVLLVRLAETQLNELFAPDIIEQAKALAER